MIQYRSVTIPSIHAIVALFQDAHIARPVHDQAAMRQLCERANVIHTAFLSERLVGFLRGWTDGICEGFIADLTVHPDVAQAEVGLELLRLACAEYPSVSWILVPSAMPKRFSNRDLDA